MPLTQAGMSRLVHLLSFPGWALPNVELFNSPPFQKAAKALRVFEGAPARTFQEAEGEFRQLADISGLSSKRLTGGVR